MKGSKEGKGDGSSHRGGGGSGSGACAVETGALFPRLHVKETKRVGPRAPPRNKMALYEQFTFPSHRFVPPSLPLPSSGRSAGSSGHAPHVAPNGEKMALYEQFTFPSHRFVPPSASLAASARPSGSSSSVLQSSPHDGSRYYCPPPFGGMGLPYMAMNVPHQQVRQPSLNGSTSSTVMDADSEMQITPSIPASDSEGPSSHSNVQASPRTSTPGTLRSGTRKKGRGNDDCAVPVYTAPKASNVYPKVYTEASDWFASGGNSQPGMDITTAYQSMPVPYEYQVESSGLTAQRGNGRGDLRTGATGEKRGTEFAGKIVYSDRGVEDQIVTPESMSGGAFKEKHGSHLRTRYSGFREHDADRSDQRRKSSPYFDESSEADGLRSCGTGNGECLTVVEDDAEFGSKSRKSTSKAIPAEDSEVSKSVHEPSQPVSQGASKKEKRVVIEKSRKTPASTECTSNTPDVSDEYVENPSECGASEHTQPTVFICDSEESDASMVEADSSCKITPRDLIDAVGQQEFWRARKLLQRQQTIFVSQLFDLHRVLEVQRRLAPDHDDICEDDDLETAPSPLELAAEKVQGKKVAPEKQGAGHGGDDLEKSKRVTGQQPDSTCQSSSTSKRACPPPANSDPQCGMDNAAPAPVLPSSGSSGASGAWSYPPFVQPGANGWYGAMPTLNGAYMYQPYPGSYPQQPPAHTMGAYNGSYRPVMCGPTPMDVAGMGSYGMTGYEQRPDLMQDMYRYNTLQQWQAAMYCNSVAQDHNASWYSAPPMPYMDPTQRMSSRWYEEMASSHPSHPGFHRARHQNSTTLMPPAQPMVYPMHPQWGESTSQLQGREVERFRAQAAWPLPGGSCQSSDPGFQGPAGYSGQESGASEPQQPEGGWGNKTYHGSEGKNPQDSEFRASEGPSAPQHSTGDAPGIRLHKRSRETTAERRGAVDKERRRDSVDESDSADVRRDALPLFPLVPVATAAEKLKSSDQSFPGVIKVIPRAMVATAESAAEILLSIQKQRQQ